MLLIPAEKYQTVFESFRNQRVGYVTMHGNPGDAMIDQAAIQLMEYFSIAYRLIDWHEIQTGHIEVPVDCLLIAGGGNMGTTYTEAFNIRSKAQELGVPVSVLPQSFIDNNEDTDGYSRVFVRERGSLQVNPRFELAPDLALGLVDDVTNVAPEFATGVFLRNDTEACFASYGAALVDPVQCCETVMEYMALAARFEQLFTDRLHFAIAGLIAGVRVTLLPNNYHKNRSVYESWLRDLGCSWLDSPADLPVMAEEDTKRLMFDLAGLKSQLLPWNYRPKLQSGFTLEEIDQGRQLIPPRSRQPIQLNASAGLVLDLCDGQINIREMVQVLTEQFGVPGTKIGQDIQVILRDMFTRGCIDLHPEHSEFAYSTTCSAIIPPSFTIAIKPAQPHPLIVTVGETFLAHGRLRREAKFCKPNAADRIIYFETDCRNESSLTQRADPFVLVGLNEAMREGRPLWIRGAPTTLSLIHNLEEFQLIWHSWHRELRKIPIWTELTVDSARLNRPALLGFSGGIDSCYSLYKQFVEGVDASRFRLQGLLIGHGFDIRLANQDGFKATLDRLQTLTSGLGLDLLTIKTNARMINPDWGASAHGLVLAASMAFFGERFGQGIIASSIPYRLLFPWGTNPISDRMMGSDYFPIYHHGGESSRLEKVRALTQWPHSLRHARFCWQGDNAESNCGRCRKCMFTAMMLRSLDMPLECFESAPGGTQIMQMIHSGVMTRLERFDAFDILKQCRDAGHREKWIEELEVHLAEKHRYPENIPDFVSE
ncbi:MAG: hypothetical protein ACI8P9_004167 [Parasphingorhabdus sp.]|jgi:hypothetical protein